MSGCSLYKPDPFLPPGMIIQYINTSIPKGWLACNGSEVNKNTYRALFDVIGNTYGSASDPANFKLPDFRGRIPVGSGQGAGLTNRTLGSIGGTETHTLTVNEIPAHTHDVANTVQYGINTRIDVDDGPQNELNLDQSRTTTSSSTGGGQAHNIMQPYLVVNYLIKY